MRIEIQGEFITIGQLLKKIGSINTGGQAKWFLQNYRITINGAKPQGRNAKVRIGDTLWINDELYKVVAKEN